MKLLSAIIPNYRDSLFQLSFSDKFEISSDFETLDSRVMRNTGEDNQLTLLTHGASPPSRALAAEVVAVILAGAPVKAGVGAAGLLGLVVKLAPDAGCGGGWRQRGRGDSCCCCGGCGG